MWGKGMGQLGLVLDPQVPKAAPFNQVLCHALSLLLPGREKGDRVMGGEMLEPRVSHNSWSLQGDSRSPRAQQHTRGAILINSGNHN